ncbi:unnamed protein product [Thelazia callipaeda]|uniref:PPM-type phosphatase domain-containing protein n=1 Tax=Thelazia callipaeda TaxID=103827 RepID=A0A0N5CS97_THECL|nr:unnamed protein product [Thelazia callipaeda]
MALIYAHEHLGATGERLGAAAMLLKLEQRQLFYACVGSTRAVLCRSGNAFQLPERPLMITCEDYTQLRTGNATITQDNVIDGICLSANSLGFSFLYPAVLPKTFQETVTLTEADEFIVIGAGALWKYISPQNAIDSIRGIYNPHIAAKKLQDMLQTFEYSGNVSIIVIRFKRSQQAHNEGETILHKSIVKAKSTCPINDMNTLRNIEERLEQISEAINKIDDDSNNHRSPSSGLELWNEQEYLNTNSNNRRSCPMSSNNNNNDLLSASSTTTSRYSASSTVSPCSIAPPDPHSDRSVNDRFSIRKRIDLYDRLNVTSSKTNGKEKFQRVKSALNEQLQLRTPEGKIMKLYNV